MFRFLLTLFELLKAAVVRRKVVDVGVRQFCGEHFHHAVAARTVSISLRRQDQVLFLLSGKVWIGAHGANSVSPVAGNTRAGFVFARRDVTCEREISSSERQYTQYDC